MQLTFSPALQEQTVLKAAPSASGSPAVTQSVLFKATFDSRESFLKAQADKVKVELWSDIPVAGRSLGHWGASQFEVLESSGAQVEETHRFSAGEEEGPQENTLYVHLRVPLNEYIGSRFAFTYRLVHPSGQVEWLGKFGRNGEILIEQGLPGVDLREGWNIAEDGTYRTHAFPGERVLGNLTDPEAWACWSWNPSGLPSFAHIRDGSEGMAMALSPRSYARGPNVPRPLVFVASHSTTLKITEQGKIVLHSSSPFARVSFSVLEHSRDLLEGVAALCNGEVSAFHDESAVIASRPPDAELPLHLLVLPMSDKLGENPVIPLRPRDLPKEAAEWDGLVLSSAERDAVEVLSGAFASKDRLAWVGSSGSELIVAPIQKIPVGGDVAHVALLTPYKDAAVRIDTPSAHNLPTPPPSPPLSNAATPATKDTRQSRTPHPAAPAAPRISSGEQREVSRRRRPASSALIPHQSPHILRRYLHMILNVVFWFWSAFVRALAVRFIGDGPTRRISGLIGLALLKTSPPVTPKQSHTEKLEERANSGDGPEGTHLEPDPTPALVEEAHSMVTSDVAAPTPHYATELLQDAQEAEPTRSILAVTLPPQSSEGPLVLLQTTGSVKGVRATVDGKSVSPASTRTTDGGIQLFRFGGLKASSQFDLILEA